jgi:hypothetical protein
MPWYEWRNVREQLTTFGRAIQGVSPYKVVIEADKRRCPTGLCDYTNRVIAINPRMFPDHPPSEQYKAAKGLLVHEAGHRRFTTPGITSPLVHFVSNMLEDERVERLMVGYYAGLGHLVTFLAELMYREAKPMQPTSDDPTEVLNMVLQSRWAERIEKPLKGGLSAKNKSLWEKVQPLVEEAWEAPDSQRVDEIAEEIISILDLKEIPLWMMKLIGHQEGKRDEDDQAEPVSGIAAFGEKEPRQEPPDYEENFDGVPLPSDHPAGVGEHPIEPAPYLDLVQAVEPLVQELVEELSFTPYPSFPEPERSGSRLSLRQAIRDPGHPFLVEEEDDGKPLTLTFRVLIDHSTSMNHHRRMDYAKRGALVLHLVGVELEIAHEIAVTPNDVLIANLESGERGLALLAGLSGKTSWEGIDVTLEAHARELLARSEDMRLILVIHDGMPDNYNRVKKLCQVLRGRIEVIGLGLDLDERCAELMRGLFVRDRLILCQRPEDLPRKLGTLLRAIYGI